MSRTVEAPSEFIVVTVIGGIGEETVGVGDTVGQSDPGASRGRAFSPRGLAGSSHSPRALATMIVPVVE